MNLIGMVVYACNPSYTGSRGKRIAGSRPVEAKLKTLSQKRNNNFF
jgi:hypothetical protein